MNSSVLTIIITVTMIGLFWILGCFIYNNSLDSVNANKQYTANNSSQDENNHLRYHSNSGSMNNALYNKLNNPPHKNQQKIQSQLPQLTQHNQQQQQQQQLLQQQQQNQIMQQQQSQIQQQQQHHHQQQQQQQHYQQQQQFQQQNHNGEIPQFLQVYIECNHDFVPPLPTFPSYRIQCLSPQESYECKESRAYLDFIINSYDNPLAETYIFMHGHNAAWHYMNPLPRTMMKLINTNYIKEQNFGGYQCYWNFGPTIYFDQPSKQLFNFLFKNTSVNLDTSDRWSYPCCSTFFVRASQIKLRPKYEYIQMVENLREWSNNYELKNLIGDKPDGYCGRIYEMMWHRILSNTIYVTVPPYCQTEEIMKTNPVLSLSQYKSWKKNI